MYSVAQEYTGIQHSLYSGNKMILRRLPNKAAHELGILAYSKSQSPVERKNSNLGKRVFLEYAEGSVENILTDLQIQVFFLVNLWSLRKLRA